MKVDDDDNFNVKISWCIYSNLKGVLGCNKRIEYIYIQQNFYKWKIVIEMKIQYY